MTRKLKKEANKVGSKKPTILGVEQLRLCLLLRNSTGLDASTLAKAYAENRQEPENYVKIYNHLIKLAACNVVTRYEGEKTVPPHNAIRKTSFWLLTMQGEKAVDNSLSYHRASFDSLDSDELK